MDEPITAEVFLVIFALTGALGALCGAILLDRSYSSLTVVEEWRPSWSGIAAALPAGCGLVACLGVQGLAFVRRSGVRGWSPISSAALFLGLIIGAALACRQGAPEAILLMLPGYLWIAFVPGREHEYESITVVRT